MTRRLSEVSTRGRGRPPSTEPCTAARHDPTAHWYRQGCRCPETRKAWSAYANDYRERRRQPGYQGRSPILPTPPQELEARRSAVRVRNRALAIGAQRRMRALMRDGHALLDQARDAKISEGRASEITGDADEGGIWPNTYARIVAMYERRRRYRGTSEHTRTHAENRDYHPSEAWADGDLDNPEARPVRPDSHHVSRSATA